MCNAAIHCTFNFDTNYRYEARGNDSCYNFFSVHFVILKLVGLIELSVIHIDSRNKLKIYRPEYEGPTFVSNTWVNVAKWSGISEKADARYCCIEHPSAFDHCHAQKTPMRDTISHTTNMASPNANLERQQWVSAETLEITTAPLGRL